jgi:pyruvate formate lyase activating enzyme
MEGVVFDIQKFSLHDGPGIRTTVFLKGCPLRCRWCSNPESFRSETSLAYLEDRCISCFSCTEVCESGALQPGETGLEVRHQLCTACGKCIDRCPENALKLYGYRITPGAVLAEVLKDRAYYERSGGGLTLSGGEVLMQTDFALEVLQLAKAEGLHTCLETSGHAREADLESLLPHVDLFLFDYKITGAAAHKEHCGADTRLILSNLEFLDRRLARIHLRCPLIPGVNDSDSHFRAIADLCERLDTIEAVELLPYHNFGEHKYRQLGMNGERTTFHPPSNGEIRKWEDRLLALGCSKIRKKA